MSLKAGAFFGATGLLVGFLVGSWFYGGTKPAEPRAPSLRQADSSLVLERTDSVPGKAPHLLPPGSKELRRVQVVVQPRRGVVVHRDRPESVHVYHDVHRDWPDPLRIAEDSAKAWREHGGPSVDSCECPAVTVDLSLVRMPDKTGRVVASSPDGTILTGLDFPMEAIQRPDARFWAVGLTVGTDQSVGTFLDRDLGPLRVGGEASVGLAGVRAQAKAGWRF